MVSKNNRKLIAEKNRKNEKQRFALRKLNVGVASVLLGITFSVYGGGQIVAHADTGNSVDHADTTNTDDQQLLADQKEVTLTTKAGDQTSANQTATDEKANQKTEEGQNSATNDNTNEKQNNTAVNNDGSAKQQTSSNQVSEKSVTASGDKGSVALASTDQDTDKQAANASDNGGAAQIATDADSTTNDQKDRDKTADTQNSEKKTNTITLGKGSMITNGELLKTSLVQDAHTATVTTAAEFKKAISDKNINTINVAADITVPSGSISARDLTIQSDPNSNKKYTLDFQDNYYNMSSNNTVTYSNLNIFSRSYWGLICNVQNTIFKDIYFKGSQLVYTNKASTITFEGTNTAQTVNSYVGLDGKEVYTDQANSKTNNKQQIIEFRNVAGKVVFASGTNTTLRTVSGNPIQIDGKGSSVVVEDNANVTLNPHTGNRVEGFNSSTQTIARGLYVNKNSSVSIGKNAILTINTEKTGSDKYVSGGLYLGDGSTITNNGSLIINNNGDPTASNEKRVGPIYLDGAATITNNGTLQVNATNLDTYSGGLINAGTGTVDLAAHSNFSISGDGSGDITAINLSGGKFTSDQPGEFNIDLSKNTGSNKALIQNGTINFTRVKTKLADGQESAPIKSIKVTFKNGVPTVDSIVGPNETGVNNVVSTLTNPDVYKSTAYFTASGEDVNINSVKLENGTNDNKQIAGNVTSESGNGDIYVNVTIKNGDGSTVTLPTTASVDQYTVNSDGNNTTKLNYTTKTDENGNFTVPLVDANGNKITLTKGATITVNATKNYVDATPDTITYSPADKTKLEEALNEASTVENSDAYKNADSDLQKAYTDAIKAGQDVDKNDLATEEQVSTALTNITNARNALNGMANPTDNKLNTTTDSTTGTKTTTLTGKAEAGSTVTAKKSDGTVIGTAQAGDDGTYSIVIPQKDINGTNIKVSAAKDGKKSSDTSVETSVDKTALTNDVNGQSATHNDPSYINGSEEAKKAYDKAVSDG
ncbi:FIVAR domain-containing protein, partial [Limosilactobacillus sp. STM2_1]